MVSKQFSLAIVSVAITMAGCSPSLTSGTPSLEAAPNTRTAPATTPTPIPPTSTPIPPTPTLDIASILVSTAQPRIFGSYPSPDGTWRVEVVIYDCTLVDPDMPDGNSLEELFLISEPAGSRALLDTELLNCGGLGAAGFGGLFWTGSSTYFYYTGAREGVPDGCGYWDRPMERLNVVDGKTEYVGAGPISPDGGKVATWIDHALTLWELDGPRIASVPHPNDHAIPGPIAWSPNGDSIAYLLSEDYCPLGTTHLVRMDLDDLGPVVLLSSTSPSFAGLRWDAANRVILTDEEGASWSYDIVLGNLRPYSK